MVPHSSVLAWRIPGTGEPGGLPSMRLHRVRHDWSDLAAAAAVPGTSSGGSNCFPSERFSKLWVNGSVQVSPGRCSQEPGVGPGYVLPLLIRRRFWLAKPCLSWLFPLADWMHLELLLPDFALVHPCYKFNRAEAQSWWEESGISVVLLCRPLLLLPSIFPSIRVFSNELTHWKYIPVSAGVSGWTWVKLGIRVPCEESGVGGALTWESPDFCPCNL